jgi:hypothetical protein
MLIIRYFILLLENRLELFQTSAGLIKSLTFTSTGLKSISVGSCKGDSVSCLQNVFHKSEKRSPNTDRICLPVPYPKQPSQNTMRIVLDRHQSDIYMYNKPLWGDRGDTVVKVLCYKSEGRWFDSRWCHWNSSLT